MSNSLDRDLVPDQELAWADGTSVLLRSLLGAAAAIAGARTLPDLYEGICRALAGRGLPSLVLVYRADTGQCQVQAHRLELQPPPRWHDLPRIEALVSGPALAAPHRHPLAALFPDDQRLNLPSLSAPFATGEDGRTGVISLFSSTLVSTDLAAIEALAALLGAVCSRIQTGLRLHDLSLRLEQRVRTRTDELAILYELASALGSTSDERAAVEFALRGASRAIAPEGIAALVCVEQRHTAMLLARGGLSQSRLSAIAERLDSRLETLAAAEHASCRATPLQWLDARPLAAGSALPGGVAGPVADTPVLSAGRVSGILVTLGQPASPPSQDYPRLLSTIAGSLGTALERIAQARAEERRRLHAIIDAAPDGVIVLDRELRLTAGNDAGLERLSALTADPDGASPPPAIAALAGNALAGSESESTVLVSPGDPPRTIMATARAIQDVNRERAVLVVLRDTTEASLMRERLFQSEKMASVGQLVSGVAHELNNPLTGIMGFAQLLLARGLDPTSQQQVSTIFGEAERASKIVQNLLSFARRRRPEKVQVDIQALIERVVALREYELKVNDIDLQLNFDRRVPPCLADPHQLQQVLLNVLTNAEHAVRNRERPRRIAVSTGAGGGFVRLVVEDTGAGIPPEHVRRVFDPFFTTKPVGEGTGLGLTISYGIIEEHGGRIDLESRPGGGTTVSIQIPVANADVATGPVQHVASDTVFRPHAILVVDDEQAIQDLLTGILTMDGHIVETARTGAEALERLAERTFDAVITDIRMPEMDGIAFYQQVQVDYPHLARRIVFTSGDTVNGQTRAFIQSTDIQFLPKPFKIGAVREMMNTVLGGDG